MRLFAILILLSSGQILQAQDKVYKPLANDWNLEVNMQPFTTYPISINYLRFRTFKSESQAIRLGLTLSGRTDSPVEDIRLSTFEIALKPGFEKHLPGTDRLSPYVGFEADLSLKTSKATDNTGQLEQTIRGAWFFGQEHGFFRIGTNLVLGADVYVIPKLYLGTEIGYGFQLINSADIVEENNAGVINEEKGGSSFRFGPTFNSSIRVGYVF